MKAVGQSITSAVERVGAKGPMSFPSNGTPHIPPAVPTASASHRWRLGLGDGEPRGASRRPPHSSPRLSSPPLMRLPPSCPAVTTMSLHVPDAPAITEFVTGDVAAVTDFDCNAAYLSDREGVFNLVDPVRDR